MIFLGEELEDGMAWSVRCKGCGEVYVLREVRAGEIRYPGREQICCHKTGFQFEYVSNECRLFLFIYTGVRMPTHGQ